MVERGDKAGENPAPDEWRESDPPYSGQARTVPAPPRTRSDASALRLTGGDDAELGALVRVIAVPMRGRFLRFSGEDWAHVEAVAARELRALPASAIDDVNVRCALYRAAVDVDEKAWALGTGWDLERVGDWLAAARRHVAALHGKQRSIFLAKGLLEAVATCRGGSATVDPLVGIAHATRHEAVRQHASRAWKPLLEAARGEPQFARHVVQRFIVPAPTPEALDRKSVV